MITCKQKETAHHWIIAPPAKPTSIGICKFCHAEKTFMNTDVPLKIQKKNRHSVTTVDEKTKDAIIKRYETTKLSYRQVFQEFNAVDKRCTWHVISTVLRSAQRKSKQPTT